MEENMSDKGSRDELSQGVSGAESPRPLARLCYVDDSRTSAYVIRRLLQPYGYQVDYFQSAEPAFVALIQEDYDLLLTDLKVSSKGMDGDDLIRTLRQSGHPKISTLPVIVITGTTDARILVDVYDAGANQVMNKPVDADELDGHIRRLLFEGRPELKVVDSQAGVDNVVPLSSAARATQTQPAGEVPPAETVTPAPRAEQEQPKSDIPVLDSVSPTVETPPTEAISTETTSAETIVESRFESGIETDQPEITNKGQAPASHEPVSGEAPVSKPVENDKESLLERAVSKHQEQSSIEEKQTITNQQEQLVSDARQETAKTVSEQADDRAGHVEPEISSENLHVEPVSEPTINEKHLDEESIIIEPDDSKHHPGDEYQNYDEIDDSILRDIDKHALVIRERSNLFGGSGISSAAVSLLELIGMRSLFQRALLAGLGIVAVLWAWNTFFEKGIPVETVLVEQGEIFQSITVPGRVVSKQRTNISASHSGRVVKIFVKEGDKIKEGQILAQLDDRDLVSRLNKAKSNLTNSREAVVQAKRSLDRLQTAYKRGAVARRFVEDAEIDLRNARAASGIAVEEVHSATLDVNKQKIKAPFAGTITARFTELGQWVGPSDSLFTLVNESKREIEVRVDAADSVSIDVGQVVAVSTDAFPGLEWQESVSRLGTAANNDNNSNSVMVYISLGNDAPTLRFGQQVDADIRTAWNPNTLKVPFEALINRDGQTFVAVVDDNNQARLTPVETGIEDFSMVEVKQGLVDGQLVILTKGQLLRNGDKVYPARNTM